MKKESNREKRAQAVSQQFAVSEVHSSSCNLCPFLTLLSLSLTHAETHILTHEHAHERPTSDSPRFHLALCTHMCESVQSLCGNLHIRYCMCGETPPVGFCSKPAFCLQEKKINMAEINFGQFSVIFNKLEY
ncbi:hypothetical protein AMECASPLE_020695 [Ameca splendens]|uniref:Uncharacterized protein n=1 Tax=Ameca splendens TaxID=208324 RepID=A0ABV0YEL7_9TELE